MSARIEGQLPGTWQELETTVGRILTECGYAVEVQKNIKLARGDVDVDVWADDHSSPPNVIAVECKLWKTAVPKNIVHAFRAVVGDSGANTGLLISAAGFQNGAVEAAEYSNVRLMGWHGFQNMFAKRWYAKYMAPRLHAEADPIIEYTEPINSRISRKACALDDKAITRFRTLREKHWGLGIGLIPLFMDVTLKNDDPIVPHLPLRARMTPDSQHHFPDAVLDAVALRPLLHELSCACTAALKEFDTVFGERA